MFRFLLGGDQHTLGLILGPIDLSSFRAKPLDDMVLIDLAAYEHPEACVLITYARSGTQARRWARETGRNVRGGPLAFSGTHGQQKLIGIVLIEPQMARFEAKPLEYLEKFDGTDFGVPGINFLLTYSANERQTVHFMGQLGVKPSQLSNDPNMRPFWERFEAETVNYTRRLAALAGREIPEAERVRFTMHDGPTEGMTEGAILAARGQDMAWFHQHPTETEYVRPVVPGEFPSEFKAEYTKVIKLPPTEPGRSERVKIPMRRVNGELIEAMGGNVEDN